KQRIAIARALVRNPKILLLDEATSALDTAAERVVQEALDRASANRTTITVAHRLSTIRDADVIYVIADGCVLESGSHEQLLAQAGAYSRLVEAQHLRQSVENRVAKAVAGDDSPATPELDGIEPNSPSAAEVSAIIAAQATGVSATESRVDTRHSNAKRPSVQRTGTSQAMDDGTDLASVTVIDPESEEGKKLINKQLQRRGLRTLPQLIMKNRRFAGMLIPGTVCTIIDGVSFPCFSIVFAKMLVALSEKDPDEQKRKVNLYAGLFFMFACIVFVALGGRNLLFSRAGEQITFNVRYETFGAMMRQDASFFDRKENGTGALTSRLATEAADVNRAISESIPAFIAGFASMIAGISIAFSFDWRLTLVIVGTLPFLTLAFYFEGRSVYATTKAMKGAYEKASQEASETVSNIRTVASLTREHTFIQQFKDNSVDPYRHAIKNHYVGCIGYGFAQSTMFLVYCLAFFVGSRFILSGYIDVETMFSVIYAIVFSAFALGLMAQQSSVLTKGLIASEKLLNTMQS
ncbi:hypothetical protein IWW38_005116, partial [Coemansia aciculifera]